MTLLVACFLTMRVAAIDLGSNSFHMLVAEIRGTSTFGPVVEDRMMIQIGRDALVTGRLDPATVERGLRCLDGFRRVALSRRVEHTLAVATSAIREAENGREFLKLARDRTGLTIRVISGREEARLIHLAVSHHIDLGSRRALLIDIGGGSVELSVADAERIHYATSLRLGFFRLHGRFVNSDPATRGELRAAKAHIAEVLARPIEAIRKARPEMAIATSGSATTLLRLARRSGASARGETEVSRADVRGIRADLSRHSSMESAREFDLDPLRAKYLPTALLCLEAILEGTGAMRLRVSPVALREGLIYDFLRQARPPELPAEKVGDPRYEAVIDLARRYDFPSEHSHRVALLAGQIFRQIAPVHRLGDGEGRLLEYGAILHDIGYHISYAQHHKHGQYLVANGDLRAFSPEERAIVANIVRYHRRAAPRKSHAPFAALDPSARKVVRSLSAILRIADALDRSHFSLVDEVRCRVSPGRVRFEAVTRGVYPDIHLDLEAVRQHARFFERHFAVVASFVVRKRRENEAGETTVASGEEGS